jgi:protein transport protein SEC61 subunit gamma-like protein
LLTISKFLNSYFINELNRAGISMRLNKESIVRFMKMNQRVLRVAKRPDREEYINVAKITGLGIIVIGVIGFIISLITQLLGKI